MDDVTNLVTFIFNFFDYLPLFFKTQPSKTINTGMTRHFFLYFIRHAAFHTRQSF